jgi:glycosyltransferase involved in cell wall biosynthesis
VNTEQIRAAQEISWSVRDLAEVPDSCFLIGHAGRLIDTKAQDDLIEAVGRVQRALDEDVYLIIAGDGENREKLISVAQRENIASNVVFLGLIARERVYKLMGELDVFAMPSKWEGFSSAATEAMAVGTPCVLSDIQAFHEPFEGVAKFHPVGDVAAMSDRIRELLVDETTREEFGTAGKERVEARFTVRKTAEEYERIYREVTGHASE